MKNTYSLLVGLKKTLKNMLIIWAPAILASMAALANNAPEEYAGIAGILASGVAYLIKNYLENK